MTLATLLLAAACLLVLAELRVRVTRVLAGDSASLVGRSVVVSTVGDSAYRGVVHAEHPDRLVLRDVTVLVVGSDAEAPAGGLVHVPTSRVEIVQEPPAAGTSRSPIGG